MMTIKAAVPSPNLQGFDFDSWSLQRLQWVEHALDVSVVSKDSLHGGHTAPAVLVQAMRYAVLDGGKRLRPLLVFAAYEAVTAGQQKAAHRAAVNPAHGAAVRAACAVELIHAYSLVHDDMPCMDNDVLRRGKPTVHVQFGEATALLAGDALQALAFELLTPTGGEKAGAMGGETEGAMEGSTQARLCGLLARAAGCMGMAGGQAIDLASVGQRLSEQELRQMHQLKTGALLQGSVLMGAHCGGQPSAQALAALQAYGAAIGLAFQVVDDILDVTADSATLGKTAGKDAHQAKPTYVSVLGLQRSQAYAQELLEQALQTLQTFNALQSNGLRNTQALVALADMVVNRSS